MFGAPLKSFCLDDKKEPEVVETFENGEENKPVITAQTTLGELCDMKDAVEAEPVMEEETEPVMEEETEPVMEEETEPVMEEEPEAPMEEEVVEPFGNRVMFGQRFLSLDLALRAVLYALLFFIVSHKDTQGLLKGVVKMVPKAVKPFFPMVLFGVLYYVLNLFI